MKKIILSLVLCGSSLFAASPYTISKDQISITSDGIFVLYQGHMVSVESLVYIGEGFYAANEFQYGECKKCGWPKNNSGKCLNRLCNGYGPNKD